MKPNPILDNPLLDPTLAAEYIHLREENEKLRTSLMNAAAIIRADARTLRDTYLNDYSPEARETLARSNEVLAEHFRDVARRHPYRPRNDNEAA